MPPSTAIPHEVLQQAAEWFALLRSGEASPGEQAAWQAWLAGPASHGEAWRRVQAIGQRFAPLQAAPERQLAAAALDAARERQRGRRKALGRLALVAGGGVAGWAAWRHTPLPGELLAWGAEYRTGTGEQRELLLADGTRLWLNSASALDTDYGPALRRLRLRAGDLLVQTAADPQRPFVVETAQGALRALGTRFAVRLREEDALLAVYEGAVELRTAHGGRLQRVPAGSQLQFSADAIGVPAPAERTHEAWTRGVLLAQDMALQELVQELRRHRRGHLGLAPELAGLRVFGNFPLRDTDQALAMLEAALPLRVRRTLPWWTSLEPLPAAARPGA